MAAIRWTSEAAKWLKDIHDYIARDSSTAAGKVVLGIYQKAQILAQFPEMGGKYREVPEGEVRILLYGHYRIAYPLNAHGGIDILGVFHGALDIDKYLTR